MNPLDRYRAVARLENMGKTHDLAKDQLKTSFKSIDDLMLEGINKDTVYRKSEQVKQGAQSPLSFYKKRR